MRGIQFLPFALFSVACSSSGGGGNVATTDASVDADGGSLADARAACDAVAASVCARENACSPFFVTFGFGDEAGCRAAISTRCKSSVGLPGVSYGAAELSACAAKVPSGTCDQIIGGKILKICSFSAGTLDNGKKCFSEEQCKSSYCQQSIDTGCGTCAPAPAVGDSCTGDLCGLDQGCIRGRCVALSGPGGACTVNAQCPFDQACAGGTCVAALKEGDSCDPTSATAKRCSLNDGLLCLGIPGSAVCTKVGLGDVGAACGQSSPTSLTLCKNSGNCSASPTGTCVAAPAPGQPCSTLATACGGAARCISNVCRLPDPTACL